MVENLKQKIFDYREKTYRFLPKDRLQSQQEAVDYINQRGFLLFHPSKDIDFPSLWGAKAGNRPVPNEHDDPGHITWQWKDELLGQRKCYYGRLLGQKMSFVSLDMLPYLFRLSNNIEYENDYLLMYQKGEMSYEAKRVYECLLDEGPMDTLALRKKVGLSGKENQYRYTKTLNWLQTELMLLPIGVAEVGRWNYGFIFDIVPRYFLDLPDQSLKIRLKDARVEILKRLVLSLGATDERNIRRLLRWSPREIESTLVILEETGFLRAGITVKDMSLPQFILNQLLI